MIARMQKFWTLGTLLGLAVWLLWAWPRSPAGALIGALLGAVVFALLVGLQFMLMHRANRSDPAPPASTGQVWRAWWAEMGALLRVFCWRQPFRSRAVPDWLPAPVALQGATAAAPMPSALGGAPAPRGVVLVHGLLCNRGVWLPWLAPLRARGHAFAAVNLEPVFGAIDDYAPLIEEAVQRVTQATGRAPVLVCHSMGGVAVRAWLRAYQADARVHHVITLGTPHGGTALARFSRTPNGMQMRQASDWLLTLQRSEPPARAALFTCWYSNCDNIVFPASTGALPGAAQRFIAGVGHVQMASHPQVVQECLERLARD
ncbi:MAG: alpha/beta fold hydrolase [Rhodoferax sp.]|nr:alpha/beta fold hydrolase [Rhodoferax sp.]